MDRIAALSFDMEGTLVDNGYSRQIWEVDIPRLYGEARGLAFDDAKRKVMSEYASVGEGDANWYDAGYWWRRLGLPGNWKNLPQSRKAYCRVYPEVPGVLERLGRRYPLIVTSNTIREFLEVQLECVGYGFRRAFSAPSDFGEVKNSGKFYSRVLRELGLEPGSLVHVGDNRDFDYEAPRSIGVKSFHLDRTSAAGGAGVVRSLTEFESLLSGP